MEKHSEVFVAFDVAKKKHAIAIAEGGRTGEVRFLGDIKWSLVTNSLADCTRTVTTSKARPPSGTGIPRARSSRRPRSISH